MNDHAPVVETPAGMIRGRRDGDVSTFLGVPYAAPPFGSRRLREPRPVEPWTGMRDATRPGPTVPKSDYPAAVAALLPEVTVPGTDCLNLNVWTSRTTREDSDGAPVLVWVHGGSFTSGSGANGEYDGTAFARSGVVCVTLNYRLGGEGFLTLPGAPTNRGLRDVIAALEWVRDSITAFGGDPARVTLAGESAGAMAVAALRVSPAARGLFTRTVLQSAACPMTLDPAQADRITSETAHHLGVAATRDAFAAVPPERLVAAVDAVVSRVHAPGARAEFGELTRRLPFGPVVDGDLLPVDPLDPAATAHVHGLPSLIGTTRDEGRLFFVPGGAIDAITDAMVTDLAADYGVTDLTPFVGPTPGETFVAVYTHARFERTAEVLARAPVAPPAWRYRFDGIEIADNDGLGSGHTTEVPFVFDTVDRADMRPRLGPRPSRALADLMHTAWTRFVTDGDPGWEPATTAHLGVPVRHCPDREESARTRPAS